MAEIVRGQLVLPERVYVGELVIEGETIADIQLVSDWSDEAAYSSLITPGLVDLHVHGWGGHSAMGDRAALAGMSRALLAHGVTSFLPTAVTAPIEELEEFGARVRDWMPTSPGDGAQALGFNLEGPFLSDAKRGAHDPASLMPTRGVGGEDLLRRFDGLRVITIAPELTDATPLIWSLAQLGVVVSLGHSAASFEEANAGFAVGARSTTHLFNAMSGLDHRSPGLALAALLDDRVYIELIADGVHFDLAMAPLVARMKPADRLLLVSDAIALAGTGDGRGMLGSLEVEVKGDRATLAGTSTLAGSVLSLDKAVRNMLVAGIPLHVVVAAASSNPLELLGIHDRGRLAVGQRADLVELDTDLQVRRVMLRGEWLT